jgi:RNA polymerase sigma-70 factor (ECF subfamily)
MSSSVTRYFPGVAGRTESSATKVQDLTSSPIRGGERATQSRPSGNFVQDTANISTPSLSDEDLMSLICDGDKEALASLFRRYARVVRGVAYRVLRDTSEADDLLQDIFLLVHRLCGTFDSSKGPARFWILQMTYHRAISRRRYLASRQFYTRRDLDDVATRVEGSSLSTQLYEDTIDGMFGKGTSQKMFEALSEKQRETLRLFFFEGYTLDEIASMLGQSRVNIKHHYFRGLDKLRRDIFGLKLRGDQQYDTRLHPS